MPVYTADRQFKVVNPLGKKVTIIRWLEKGKVIVAHENGNMYVADLRQGAWRIVDDPDFKAD